MSKGKSKIVARPKDRGNKILSVTLADCDLTTFSAGGPGGQHQNTSNTAVRIKHRDSGAVGEARDNRSQTQNKQAAFRRMTEDKRFKVWLNKVIYVTGKTPEQKVKEDMVPWNLRVETFSDNEWRVTT
jgi:hypothetical protein